MTSGEASLTLMASYLPADEAGEAGAVEVPFLLSSSTSRLSPMSSLTRTLKDSGRVGGRASSPLTMASYIFDRPSISSLFTVSISCRV